MPEVKWLSAQDILKQIVKTDGPWRIPRRISEEDLERAELSPPDSITCPRCGFTSHHPEDIERRYCGRCRDFHSGGK